ncbi:lipase [Pleurotus eryngii]|uniref:Carboxylic ester hydrolase n=1 Tax=Pleurotus eryngii TaxID=5323 RepID=A0A9P6D2U2_PLEER|nr:lipase [Pleurotus eryngii]
MFFILSAVLGLLAVQSAANPLPRANRVVLDSATFTGSTAGRVTKFLGIPYAQPPTGDRRFRLPVPIPPYTGTVQATAFGSACPQQSARLPLPDGLASDVVDLIVNTAYKAVFPDNEDCLSINVVVPSSATPTSKLPVAVWIFGGGFELGSPSLYDGGLIVERSIQLGEPVIYVSMNYRVSAFGFLASQEVKDAGVGNLGLQDQREALRWIQKYISSFGGDPTKVTIWGESAGAISVALHMVANNGNHEGLFRGAFMQSGSPIPVGDVSHGQTYYDAIVAETGCSGASDTLACLRSVPYSTLKTAADHTPFIFDYQSLALAWLPRADGVFLTDNPQKLVQAGKVANVPFVTGDCDDEGTLFSLANLNVTTTSQVRTYIKTFFMPQSTNAELDHMLNHYPLDLIQGSPFGTGILNALSPQFKRLAAFQGDAVFQAPRRFFLQQRSGKQNTWAFLSKRFKVAPFLGSFHASDILNVYFGGELGDYLINFVNKLDPNGQGRGINWPKYTTSSPNLVTFNDNLLFPVTITQDTFRKDAINFLTGVTLANPL